MIVASLIVACIGVITWQHSVRAELLLPRKRWLQASLLLSAGMLLEGEISTQRDWLLAVGSGFSNAGISLQLTIIARLIGLRPPRWLWLAVGVYSAIDKWVPNPLLSTLLDALEIPLLYLCASWLFMTAEQRICNNRYSLTALLFLLGAMVYGWRDGHGIYQQYLGFGFIPHQELPLHALALTLASAAQVCGSVGFLNIVLQKQNSRLQDVASLDPLTSAGNRRALQHWLDHLDPSMEIACVIMLDIDHFKAVNDRYGHLAGDQVLQSLSQELRGHIRDQDLLIRYGGEEFCLVLPNIGISSGERIIDRLRRQFSQLQPLTQHPEARCSFSAGIHLWRCQQQDFGQAQQSADQALYQAKQAGRNQVVRSR
nr:GGDEF domain-containing protein [Chromobacterium aquaticum]